MPASEINYNAVELSLAEEWNSPEDAEDFRELGALQPERDCFRPPSGMGR